MKEIKKENFYVISTREKDKYGILQLPKVLEVKRSYTEALEIFMKCPLKVGDTLSVYSDYYGEIWYRKEVTR